MQDSALILLAGVLVCFLTIASVFANVPLIISGMLCFGGVGLIFAAMYEMTVNYN
jgi:hypothetical protein